MTADRALDRPFQYLDRSDGWPPVARIGSCQQELGHGREPKDVR